MNFFDYGPQGLACESVSLTDLAHEYGTPLYVYSQATLERHIQVFSAALISHKALLSPSGEAPLVAFAVKANSNISVLSVLARQGSGADTVSKGEVLRALTAGIAPEKIIFSGVGKTDDELSFALKAGLYQLNVESEPELYRLAKIAESLGVVAPVTLRINPKVGAGGHAKITTGGASDKFGISSDHALRLYASAQNIKSVKMLGLSCHIGSQISSLEPLKSAFSRMRQWVEALRAQGLLVERLDLGGGLGVPYFDQPDPPSPELYGDMVNETLGDLGLRLIFEPGRLISANAGVLLSRIIHVHERPDEDQAFLVLDAAMNDLMRPALYDAYHDIRPVIAHLDRETKTYDVVGPVCETGDTFTRGRKMSALMAGELVAFMTAGAYGAVMSNEYNTRPLVPEVLVNGEKAHLVRKRPEYDDIFARESLPSWLEKSETKE